jgi:molybdate transport repressor ModE-like protein
MVPLCWRKEIRHLDKPILLPEQRAFSIEDLRLLAALQVAGSLAGAARSLDLNHASAWRRLGALENRLGVRLFERERSGYAPTPAGEEAIAMAGRVLVELDETARRLIGQDVRPSGTVRLTTTEALLAFAPVLQQLHQTHPGVLVEVVTANTFFMLTRRDADIALRPAEAVPEGLVARRLGTIATALYAAPEYLADWPDRDPMEMDWLAPDDSLSHLRSARWIAQYVRPERIIHRANSLAALREAARAGLGVAALPCFMIGVETGLHRLARPIAEMGTKLWLITHPDLRRMPRVRGVMDAVAAYMAVRRSTMEADPS